MKKVNVGKRLKAIQVRKNIAPSELARRAGKSNSGISGVFGKPSITTDTLQIMMQVLDTTAAEIFGETVTDLPAELKKANEEILSRGQIIIELQNQLIECKAEILNSQLDTNRAPKQLDE